MSESSAETSEAEVVDVKVDAPAPDAKTSAAESSSAEPTVEAKAKPDGDKKVSILDAVKSALDKTKDKSPESKKEPDLKSEAEAPVAEKKDGEEAEETDDLTAEELSQLKAKTRKSFERLTANNADLKGKLEDAAPKAEQFDRVVKFVADAGLVPSEVNQLFDIGKNLKSNPRAAYDQIKPVYEQLQRMYGDVLPDDLQQRVNQGLITEPDAKALAVARTNAAVAEQSATRLRAQDEQRRTREANQVHVNEVQTKVSEWESSKEKADPDWKLKQPYVMQAIENAVLKRSRAGQPPPTAAEAVGMAETALTAVNEQFKRLAPRPKAITPVTDVGSTRATAKPATALEAAKAGLAKTRG